VLDGGIARMRLDPTRQRIALFGHFGAGNLGNEATLRAMVYNLRRHLPSAELSCVCSGPEITASEYNVSAAPIRARFPVRTLSQRFGKGDKPDKSSNGPAYGTAREARWSLKALAKIRAPLRVCVYPLREAYRWLKAIATLNGKSSLVMTGTGMLGDHSLNYEIFRWAVVAKLCRCKLLFVSVGAGPIRQPLRRWFVKTALKLADYRSYRDATSRDYLATIGLDVKNDPVYPDLAFSLPRTVVPADYDAGRREVVIGVGLVDYYGVGSSAQDRGTYHEYIGCMVSFVAAMLKRNYVVRILIGDFVYDQRVRHDLRKALEERGASYQDGFIIDTPASSVDELLTQLACVDIVVSSRFHNLLLALILRKPVFAISYHAQKFQPLMEGVGLSEFYDDIDEVDVDELIGKVARLQDNAEAIGAQIARQTESYRAALAEQYELMLAVLSAPMIGALAEA
jgi:polysaccharide pyruvyl transferase WcaK-like protein